jgi:hypothetical protein
MENFNRIEYSTQLYSVTEIIEYIDNENIQLKGNIGGRLWNLKQKQRYIESFLLDLPMYPIIIDGALKNPKTGTYNYWIVVDGFNRLCALSEFYKGEFALERNGVYNNLSSYQQSLIDDKKIYFYILSPETKLSTRYNFFERMNPSIKRRTIRNILNQGIANDLVQELSREFENIFKIDKRNDELNIPEFVLTYVAKLCFKQDNITLSVFLDTAISAIKRLKEEEIAKIRNHFINKLAKVKASQQEAQVYFEQRKKGVYFRKQEFFAYLCEGFVPFAYQLTTYSDKL